MMKPTHNNIETLIGRWYREMTAGQVRSTLYFSGYLTAPSIFYAHDIYWLCSKIDWQCWKSSI